MTSRRRDVLWLLLAPVGLLVGLVVVLHAVEAATPRPPDPGLSVAGASPAEGEQSPLACTRDGDPAEVDAARQVIGTQGRVTSSMVVACPAAFDGQRVTYVGELVGDLLARDGGAWVLVNDDDYALDVGPLPAHREHRGSNSGLTVWLPDELLQELAEPTGLGRPNQRGEVVQVEGRIRRADPADGGGLTLRADRVESLAPATAIDEPLDVRQVWFMVAALLVAGGLWWVRRRASRA